MPKGFVKIISEAVQFYCQNGDIEDFYRRFIEAQAVKFKGMPQFYNPTSNIEADPLGNTAESYKNAKKILLEARKYGELFYALMLPECQTLFFLNQQFSYSNNKRILHRLVADDGVLALERLKAENFIEYRETTGDDVSSLIKILEPYVLLMPPADGIAKHCYYGCVITKKGLNYCEKHRDDLATEPSEK